MKKIVGKEENAGYIIFPQCFKKLCFKVVKSQDCVVKS